MDVQLDAAYQCGETLFMDSRFFACVVDPGRVDIRVAHADAHGAPYGSVVRYLETLAGSRPLLAMNAGMYHADLSPVGLTVTDGLELRAIETAGGFGNFYLKPNGVFFVAPGGKAGILETGAYAAAEPVVRHATQSGPMLAIGGAIHPKFLPNGSSRHIRNGVGIRDDGRVVLAVSLDRVSLGLFARFFLEASQCPDALFFDGGVSSVYHLGERIVDRGDPAGPVLAVFDD